MTGDARPRLFDSLNRYYALLEEQVTCEAMTVGCKHTSEIFKKIFLQRANKGKTYSSSDFKL